MHHTLHCAMHHTRHTMHHTTQHMHSAILDMQDTQSTPGNIRPCDGLNQVLLQMPVDNQVDARHEQRDRRRVRLEEPFVPTLLCASTTLCQHYFVLTPFAGKSQGIAAE